METQKTRSRGAWWIALLVVVPVLVVGGLFLVADWDLSSDSTPVADAVLETVVTEEKAELHGPELVVPGMVEFTHVNDLSEGAWVVGLRFPTEEAWVAELAALDTGENMPLTPLDPVPGLGAFGTWMEPGTQLRSGLEFGGTVAAWPIGLSKGAEPW